MTKITTLVALLAAAALFTACGSDSLSSSDNGSGRLGASIDLGPSIGAEGAKALLQPSADGGYELRVGGAQGAKAVYGVVHYDASAQHIESISPNNGSAANPALVLIVDDPSRGEAQFGWVLPNFDQREGLSGEISIASIVLADGAAAAKSVMKAPVGLGNAFTISGQVLGDGRPEITWMEALQGDGDNNGEVNISDLTPLALSFGKTPDPTAPADSQARDADYDKNGEVNISDVTPIGLNFGVTLGGYEIQAGPDVPSIVDFDEFLRSEMFSPLPNTTSGELAWVWTAPDPITVDTVYKVVPFDSTPGKARGKESDNTYTAIAPITSVTVTDVTIQVPPAVSTDSDGDYVVILTEESVDGVDGNIPSIADVFESLQLTAQVDTAEDPGNLIDGTSIVQWRLIDGGGLATVGNGGLGDAKGLLKFVDRGFITIEAHSNDSLAIRDSVNFKLYTIDSIDLSAAPGGVGPVAVASGADVTFTATGNFDFDNADSKEISRDITVFCNWGMIPGGANTGDFSFETLGSILDTGGSSSGDTVQVSAEFPASDVVLLYDNQKKASNLVVVNIN